MVFRYQMKSVVEEGVVLGSEGNIFEEVFDKFDEWIFIFDIFVDSVFG